MTTYVLGAGASFHAGYPLAGDLGNCLYAWVKANVPSNDFWRGCIEELHEAYGGLGDIESILTDLDGCPRTRPRKTLEVVGMSAVRSGFSFRPCLRVCVRSHLRFTSVS